jgi:hypothetical protein
MKRTTRLKTEKLVIYNNQVLNFTIAKPIKKKFFWGISKRRVCGLYILYIKMTCMWTIYTIHKNDVFVDYIYYT